MTNMAIRNNNLPTYGTPGWGATLNNYLRSLEARTSSLEERVNTNSKEGVSSSSISSYRGTGVITHDLVVYDKNNEANQDKYTEELKTTTLLTPDDNDNYSLTFQNLNCYIAPTLNQSAIVYKEPDNSQGLTISFESLGIEGTAMIVFHYADKTATLSIEPCYVGTDSTVADDITNISTNFCRLGYLTKIGTNVYYTPAPSIANIAFEDKVFLTNKPCYRLYRSDTLNNEYRIGEYDFMSEGLNFHTAGTTAGATSVVYESLYNIHNFKDDKVKYFTITSSTTEGGTTARETLTAPDSDHILVYYVTLAGIVFVYEYARDDNISDNNGLACLPIEMPSLLKENFRWLQPMEAMRVAKSKYGNEMLSHMNSYNGISPQIPATPIFGTNKYLQWQNFKLGVDVNSSNRTLQIQPVLTDESTTVALNVAGGTNDIDDITTKPGIFTYNSSIPHDLYFGGTTEENSVYNIIKDSNDEAYSLQFERPIIGPVSIKIKDDDITNNEIFLSPQKVTFKSEGDLDFIIDSGTGYIEYKETTDDTTEIKFSINNSQKLFIDEQAVIFGSGVFDGPVLSVNGGTNYFWNETKFIKSIAFGNGFDKDVMTCDSGTGNIITEGSVTAKDFTVTSDVRFKNIHSTFNDSGLSIINALPIYNYSLKTESENTTIGVTAQDLQQVLPQLVDSRNPEHYYIYESKLVYVCMQAIKELQEEIEALKTKLSEV